MVKVKDAKFFMKNGILYKSFSSIFEDFPLLSRLEGLFHFQSQIS